MPPGMAGCSICVQMFLWAVKLMTGAVRTGSDYLTAYDGEQKMMQTRGRPVVVYTYRMRFERAPDSGGAA